MRGALARQGLAASPVAVAGDKVAAAARRAATAGARLLVAAGGDGTVSSVAGVAVATGLPLAVLPFGTLNHFAKDAGLPLELDAAARVAAAGRTLPVDVGVAGRRVFLNNASIGLYPRLVRERERRQDAGASKAVATLGATASVLRTARSRHLRLTVDGRSLERTTPFLLVGNNVYETTGSRLGTRTSLQAGLLSVYVARRPGRRVALRLAVQALLGRLGEQADLEARTATRVVVSCGAPGLSVGLDGEALRLPTPLHLRVRPGALRLKVPA